MQYTTPVPDRLATDLAKNRITIRFYDEEGNDEEIHFEGACLEFVPRIVGRNRKGELVRVPLEQVLAVEVDHQLYDDDPGSSGNPEPERLVYARWHRVDYGGYGELLRFIPQGNA